MLIWSTSYDRRMIPTIDQVDLTFQSLSSQPDILIFNYQGYVASLKPHKLPLTASSDLGPFPWSAAQPLTDKFLKVKQRGPHHLQLSLRIVREGTECRGKFRFQRIGFQPVDVGLVYTRLYEHAGERVRTPWTIRAQEAISVGRVFGSSFGFHDDFVGRLYIRNKQIRHTCKLYLCPNQEYKL